MRFNHRLLEGEDGETSYRVTGLDGVTRQHPRPRPRRSVAPTARVLVQGIISDISGRAEADARAAEAADRFTSLLDVVGEHVYLALVHADGRVEELFQGPGADRLLGGAEPDPEMVNWDAAIHPDDRAAYDAFNRALSAGRASDVEYRLIGADGVTRWVHDRAATRRRRDGTVEISGIVSDVTEQRRMRAELAAAHAAVSRVVEAMDDHLYTLRVMPDGAHASPSTAARTARRWSADRCRAVPTTTAVGVAAASGRPRALGGGAAPAREGEPIELEYRVVGVDGVERIMLDRLRPRREPDGTLYFDGVTRDITERRRLEDELRRSVADMAQAHLELDAAHRAVELRARTDDLTGTYNRRHFSELVTKPPRRTTPPTARCCCSTPTTSSRSTTSTATPSATPSSSSSRAGCGAELAPDELLARWGGEEFARAGARGSSPTKRAAPARRAAARGRPGDADAGRPHDDPPDRLDRRRARRRARSPSTPGSSRPTTRSTPPRGAAATGSASRATSAPPPSGPSDSEAVTLARAHRVRGGAARAGEGEAHAERGRRASRPPSRSASGCPPGWSRAAGSAAGCTTSARSRSRDAILVKPGPLDEDEWAVMRTHPVHSEAIVQRIASLRDSAAGVRHHHERYDGTGYPDRLAATTSPSKPASSLPPTPTAP